MRAEIFLKCGVERDIAAVIQNQVKLDFIRPRPRQVSQVKGVAIRRNERRIGPVVILPIENGFAGERSAAGFAVLWRRVPPVSLPGRPGTLIASR
jgi:hypothetical protein